MLNKRELEQLWSQKYRPSCVAELILPDRFKKQFQAMVDKNELQNCLLVGLPGTGKTSAALAMCNELDLDYILINASENGNIDMLRTTIRSYASTVSTNGQKKVIILDESDYLNCLEENEEILIGTLDNYKSVSLKDLPRDCFFDIVSFNQESRKLENDTAHVVSSGVAELYEVELCDGRIVKVTGDHPFIIEENGEIKQKSILEGLNENDNIVTVLL